MHYLTNDKKWVAISSYKREVMAYFTNETSANEWVNSVQSAYKDNPFTIIVMRTKEYQNLK